MKCLTCNIFNLNTITHWKTQHVPNPMAQFPWRDPPRSRHSDSYTIIQIFYKHNFLQKFNLTNKLAYGNTYRVAEPNVWNSSCIDS